MKNTALVHNQIVWLRRVNFLTYQYIFLYYRYIIPKRFDDRILAFGSNYFDSGRKVPPAKCQTLIWCVTYSPCIRTMSTSFISQNVFCVYVEVESFRISSTCRSLISRVNFSETFSTQRKDWPQCETVKAMRKIMNKFRLKRFFAISQQLNCTHKSHAYPLSLFLSL